MHSDLMYQKYIINNKSGQKMLFSIICPPIILQTFRFYFFATYSFTMSSNSTSNFNTLFGLISCPAPRSP